MRTPALLLLLLPVLSLVACGSSKDDGGGAPVTPPPAASSTTTPPDNTTPPVAGTPVFHFLVPQDGAGAAPKEVTEIVWTDPFNVRIDGLAPNTQVILGTHLYTPGSKGRGYSSTGTFMTDANGAIDIGTMPSAGGTWTGVDGDAILWSGKEGPLAEGLGPDRSAIFFDVTAVADNTPLGTGSLKRLAMADDITVEKVTTDGLVAELFMPKGATDKMPIVAFGGSEGGISGGESYAMELASLGYPTLAVAYFGTTGVPDELTEIPLEYFGKAFTYLDSRPETRKGKAIVIGGSRGGELALLLGSVYPNTVAGVIAETPSSYRWAGLTIAEAPAWTFQGKPLVFVPDAPNPTPVTTVKTPTGQSAYVLRPTFEEAMKDAKPDDLEAARTRVEDIVGSVLMIGGSDDQMWPACDFISRAMTVLTTAGHVAKYADEGVCYPNAGHWVGSHGLPTVDSMWASLQGETYALGGTAEGNGHSGRQVQAKVKAFLARVAK